MNLKIATAEDMYALGVRLGSLVIAGDVVVLTGPLGAGKTKLVQGIGAGMNVEGHITSPTFVVARIHKNCDHGPDLIHVDAYRLSSLDDLETLGIEDQLNAAVVMEWGAPFADVLNPEQLHIEIERSDEGTEDSPDAGERFVTLRGVGERWNAAVLARLNLGAS